MKIAWTGDGCVSDDDLARNVAYCAGLGLPDIGKVDISGIHDRPLAVVGGGRSVLAYADQLRVWPGDVWAVNGTFDWCRSQGIDATFFTVDADPIALDLVANVKKAIVPSRIAPCVFDRLIANGAEIETFFLDPTEAQSGPTSATAAPHVSLRKGYKNVTFFGCESSYSDGATHTYTCEASAVDLMKIAIGGEVHLTKPEFQLQAQCLAAIIKSFPGIYREKSGGLLRGFIEHDDYDIVWVSTRLWNKLKPIKEGEPMSPEALLRRIEKLKADHKQIKEAFELARGNLNAVNGALKECQYWLEQAPKDESASNVIPMQG